MRIGYCRIFMAKGERNVAAAGAVKAEVKVGIVDHEAARARPWPT
jgi:hypothetical protein